MPISARKAEFRIFAAQDVILTRGIDCSGCFSRKNAEVSSPNRCDCFILRRNFVFSDALER